MPEKSQQAEPILNIVVTGAFSTGKSTFIDTIGKKGLQFSDRYEVNGDVLGVHFSVLTFEGDDGKLYEIHFLTTPGSRRLDAMWLFLEERAATFVVMINSVHPETFRESKSIIETFKIYAPCPFVIAANMQDKYGAWDTEALRIALRIPDEIPVVPCIATDKQSVINVLIALCEEVLKDIDDE